MSSPRQILLVGGPLDGVVHELYGGLRPEEIAFGDPDDPEGPLEHHYRLGTDGTAQYLRSGPWKRIRR